MLGAGSEKIQLSHHEVDQDASTGSSPMGVVVRLPKGLDQGPIFWASAEAKPQVERMLGPEGHGPTGPR
jgi:hypothetical protein